ncbi:MAG: ComEC/Rec2 family competence protein [Atopobiaceae bacterium]
MNLPEKQFALVITLGIPVSVGMLVTALIVLFYARSQMAAQAVLIIMACVIAAILANKARANVDKSAEALSQNAISSWEFVVVGSARKGEDAYSVRALALRNGVIQANVRLRSQESLGYLERIKCIGRFSPNTDDGWGRSQAAQGIAGTVRVVRLTEQIDPSGIIGLIAQIRKAVLGSFDATRSDARAILAGCVCGDKTALSERTLDEAFAAAGVAHLVAVSGSHLAIVAALVEAIAKRRSLGRTARHLMILLCCGCFVIFAGAALSAMRAYAMVVSSQLGERVGRRNDAVSSASAVCMLFCLVDPTVASQLGFLLSGLSVIALSLFAPYGRYVVKTLIGPHDFRRLPAKVRRYAFKRLDELEDVLGSSLVAQLITTPLVATSFGEFSVVSPVTNLLLSPAFVAVMSLGLLAAALVWVPPLQRVVLLLCDVVCGYIAGVVHGIAAIPFASLRPEGTGALVLFAAIAVLLVVVLAWPQVSRRSLVVILAAVLVVPAIGNIYFGYFAPPEICVLNVGQGDAILLRDGATTMLVDTGPDDALISALERNHLVHLDAVLITHLHEDHYGGVDDLVGRYRCDAVYVAQGVSDNMDEELQAAVRELSGQAAIELVYGDELAVGNFHLRVVSPAEEVSGLENPDSIMCLVSYDHAGKSMSGLLTGDAEKDQNAEVISCGDVGDVDFLKVGHHGSEASLTPEQAEVLRPEVSVASAGRDNSYGHPAAECVKTLEDAGSYFVCTKDAGDVSVYPQKEGVRVHCAGAL